jgi:ferritin-like metal-binding protein YciE
MGIQSAHAIEKQATRLINRQFERIETYPATAAVIRQPGPETEVQIQRLDSILQELGSSPRRLRTSPPRCPANMAALAHTAMSDEIMKNHFSNEAFEAFEQATYRSLIAKAQVTGFQRPVAIYETSLREEEKTLATLLYMTQQLTTKLLLSGEQAER